MQKATIAVFVLCLGWAAARPARFVVETSSLKIQEPASIAGTYEAAIGAFGVPLYGGTLLGSVEYVRDHALGCNEFGSHLPQGDMPKILLVDRGDCFFVQKAWHAQQAGAAAVVVADHTQEHLVTMAVPEDHPDVAKLVEQISIPVVLITKDTGAKVKSALADRGAGSVIFELDWKEAITHPDDRVEWEFWMSTNDGCGESCDSQKHFLVQFKETAQTLDKGNATQFTPHMLSRACSVWLSRDLCNRDCIHHGRYCAWDSVAPQFKDRYQGSQVVEENKRHMCAFKHLNDTGKPWAWWDFAAKFAQNCTMESSRFGKGCAEEQMRAAGVDTGAVAACMGDSNSDSTHDVLEAELREQRDERGSGRGRVIMLPTIVMNTVQYRGRLTPPDVLRALCSGFDEGTEPPVCLAGGLNTDECAAGRDDCWRGPEGQSACVDTFRGFVCRCPHGWQGDGKTCEDIDECALHIDGCDQVCVNTPGSYRCECKKGYTLHGGNGSPGLCIPSGLSSKGGFPVWGVLLIVGGTLAIVGFGGAFAYRWRMRREMHEEIRSIMRQYMPLDTQERAELGRTLLGGGGSHGGDDDMDKHGLAPSGAPPARSAPSLTEMAQVPSPRMLPRL